MDALNASSAPSSAGSHLDLSWSKPAVKLLLITGVALAALGALLLIGITYPIAALALLDKTFTTFGAGFLVGSGFTLFLFTAISTFVVLRKPNEGSQQTQEKPKPAQTNPSAPSPSITGHPKPSAGYRPAPDERPGNTGSRGRLGDHANTEIIVEDC